MICTAPEADLLLAIFAGWAVAMILLSLALALSIIQRRSDIRRMHRDRRRSA